MSKQKNKQFHYKLHVVWYVLGTGYFFLCFTFIVFIERKMATLVVPPVPPSPLDDAVQLYRAFKGTFSNSGPCI